MPVEEFTGEIIAISGHRYYPDRGALIRGLDNMRAKEYVFGGARGVDSDALDYITKTQPGAIRTVVVPNRIIDQSPEARAIIEKNASQIIELRNKGSNRYQIRNQFMVDRSTRLRAFYDNRGSGGTFNTINYAKSIGKPYDIWSLKEYDINKVMEMPRQDFDKMISKMRIQKVNINSIKGMIIKYLTMTAGVTVREYILSIGSPGDSTLEQAWTA